MALGLFYFKKWYFDCIDDSGHAAYFYLISTSTFGIKSGMISVYISEPENDLVEFTFPVKFKGGTSGKEVRFRGGHFKESNYNSELVFKTEEAELELSLTGLEAEWSTRGEDEIFRKKERFLRWKVLQPSAEVVCRFEFGGQKFEFKGLGYQDRVESNIPLWKLPIRELYWGRIHAGELTIIYDVVKFESGDEFKLLYLNRKKFDDSLIDPTAKIELTGFTKQTGDFEFVFENNGRAVLKREKFHLLLQPLRKLVNEPVITEKRVKFRWLRRVLAKLSGNPFEEKIFARAQIRYGDKTYSGNAIHERVIWRRSNS